MMMHLLDIPLRPSRRGEPSWELLDILPLQGDWTVKQYKKLVDQNRMVEYTDGRIEVLPMPTLLHQLIAVWFCQLLNDMRHGTTSAGRAVVAPFILKLRVKKYRLPDVAFMKRENADRIRDDQWLYADLLMEVVSKGGRKRDYEAKRLAYAEAGIPEYWIVDPIARQVTVLVLDVGATTYRQAGVYKDGDHALSPTVTGLKVDVSDMLNRPLKPE